MEDNNRIPSCLNPRLVTVNPWDRDAIGRREGDGLSWEDVDGRLSDTRRPCVAVP